MIRGFSRTIDFSRLFSPKTKVSLETGLRHAALNYKTEDYLSFAVFLAIILPAPLLLLPPSIGFAAFPISFAAIFCAFLYLPKLLAAKRAAKIDAELPIVLRTISTELSMRTPFEKAVCNSAENCKGELGIELRKVARDIDSGISMTDNFNRLANRSSSESLKRAAMQMLFSYEHGLYNEGLRKLSDEISANQRAKVRAFHAQTAFLGLLFTTISCIVPALFSAYLIVGSGFLSIDISPRDVFVIYILGFPLADAAILFFLKEKMPATMVN